MALLYRFSKVGDRNNTGIFTFIVTRSVTRDLHRDATTKDFYYGYHRWAISFSRANDKVLGVYLILRDPSPSANCYVDFSISLLNREHFSRNEQYSEKQCKFASDHPAHGINKWIPLSDIQTRNFGDETGEFLLELSIGNVMTVFEAEINLQSNGANTAGSLSASGPGSTGSHHPVTMKNGKIETTYFHFGTFEWNISITPHNANSGGAASMVRTLFKDNNNDPDAFRNVDTSKPGRSFLVSLNRLTGFENSCRIQYRFVLGQGQFREDSTIMEQISDMSGKCRGYQVDQHTFANITSMGTLHLYFEFFSCNPISEVKVPFARSISPVINCYDRNKQGWSIESDMESEFLKLKLYFMDMHSVPRNHLRYVSWFIYVLVTDPQTGLTESVPTKNSPHFNYYIQDGIDMGVVMETTIPVSDVKTCPKKYLENDSHLTAHVEWYDSIMLFNHIYHKYDDIARTHCHQMRREIAALTSENYSLERQIFAYQRSISMANNIARMSISSPSKPNPTMGFASSPTTHLAHQSHHRSHGHLADTNSYYNNDIHSGSPDGYYESPREATLPEITANELSPASLQPSQQPQQQHPKPPSYRHSQYFTPSSFQLTNTGSSSGPCSARHSFSGPASPHHQSHSYLHAAVQQQQQQQQSQQQYSYHHQLPAIPTNKIPYSSSGYLLNSPSGNPMPGQMYRQFAPSGDECVDEDDGGNGSSAGGQLIQYLR